VSERSSARQRSTRCGHVSRGSAYRRGSRSPVQLARAALAALADWLSGGWLAAVLRSPTFMFKVPRGEAAFTVLVANFPVLTVDKPTTCLFTLADEYRASPHTCSPVLAVNFWNEFGTTKDLVLVRATILPGVALDRCAPVPTTHVPGRAELSLHLPPLPLLPEPLVTVHCDCHACLLSYVLANSCHAAMLPNGRL
jgi:hypothetical protein